jgi:hypothetical protein
MVRTVTSESMRVMMMMMMIVVVMAGEPRPQGGRGLSR